VVVDGVDLARCDPAGWRAQLAWLPQRPRLAPGTLREALDDGRGLTDTALLAAMVRAGAPPLSLDAVLGERTPLSAGEIRRLALARALALPKPLLLLDEPTTHLDPASADTVRDAIAALPRDGLVVFATHDPELVALADVVVELAPRLREQVA
jgi:ABC-type transport system involved in cytochrome bd biosynthesis fused ATPase/permease subunit